MAITQESEPQPVSSLPARQQEDRATEPDFFDQPELPGYQPHKPRVDFVLLTSDLLRRGVSFTLAADIALRATQVAQGEEIQPLPQPSV